MSVDQDNTDDHNMVIDEEMTPVEAPIPLP